MAKSRSMNSSEGGSKKRKSVEKKAPRPAGPPPSSKPAKPPTKRGRVEPATPTKRTTQASAARPTAKSGGAIPPSRDRAVAPKSNSRTPRASKRNVAAVALPAPVLPMAPADEGPIAPPARASRTSKKSSPKLGQKGKADVKAPVPSPTDSRLASAKAPPGSVAAPAEPPTPRPAPEHPPRSLAAAAIEPPRRPPPPPDIPPPQLIGFGDEDGWTPLADDPPRASDEPDGSNRGVKPPPPRAATGSESGWESVSEDGWEAHGEAAAPAASRAIPPLPDEDDVFEPIEDEDESPPREPPPGATPHDVLVGVRRGALHVSALNAIPDEMIEALADDEGLAPATGERRADLLRRLLEHRVPEPVRPPVEVEGLLELFPDGFGFIRRAEYGYVRATSDPFVPAHLVRELALSTGHWLAAKARPARTDEKYAEVIEILGVNHEEPTAARDVAPFDQLVVTHPDHRFLLETEPEQVSMRIMDLFCPLGRGQRALVVSPPRAGKTILLQGIADSLARNSPEVDIVVLLVDERPEEVTNMKRSIRGEVFASTFDQPAHRHIRLAELVLEKVKRMVEFGRHVVLLLDSLTRLGRAYNNESAEGGRLLTGGLDATALTKPKAFFGAARNIEHGGSLTIVASALVDTGSRLDQVIFEEFKGTGNMEIALSRDLAYRRLWPAIDIPKSGTRKEDLLLHPEELRRITILRRAMAGQEAPEVLTDLLYKMEKHRTNAEFLMMVQG